MNQAASARSGNLLLLVGTKKGSFLLTGDSARRNWTLSGPYNQGAEVFHLAYDSCNGGRILADANYMIWGPQLEFSDDLGGSWTPATQQPRFTEGDGPAVNRIWHIEPTPAKQPGVVYAGVESAALFRSNDYGVSWDEVTGLSKHPTRPEWQPGFGGLCLRSIVTDPSTPSAFGWAFRPRAFGAPMTAALIGNPSTGASAPISIRPDPLLEWGQCPHKVLSPRQDLIYQQNDCGVFRTDSGGVQWDDITEGLPSRFGFVLGPALPGPRYHLRGA